MYSEKLADFEKLRNNTKNKAKLKKIEDDQIEYLLDVGKVLSRYSDDLDSASMNNLIHEYLQITQSNYISTKLLLNNVKCENCNEYYDSIEGFDACFNCGTCINNIHYHTQLSYKEIQETEFKPHFNYEKESHLTAWLDRLTSKENKIIPNEVLDLVKSELKKERITDYSKLKEDKIKDILKKLKLNEYYDCVISIINKLSGRKPIILTPEIREKVLMMFAQIQEPFNKFKEVSRKNMISYPYLLHQIFKQLKLPEFAEYFPLLKNNDKLRAHDELFKKIVEYMKKIDNTVDWKFYPSY